MAAPLDRTWFNTLIDDDGSGLVGTVWNKTQVDGLMDTIDASLVNVVDKSATPPTAGSLAAFTDADTIGGSAIYVTPGGNGLVRNTVDGADSASLFLGGGGDAAPTRGAFLVLRGNEHGTAPGRAELAMGNVAGAAIAFIKGDGSWPVWIHESGLLILDSGQLRFPATQKASTDPNTIDDYLETAWTPVLGGDSGASGQTYLGQAGQLLKFGRHIWFTGLVELSNKGTLSGTGVVISGLPYTVSTGAVNPALLMGGVALYATNLATPICALAGVLTSSGQLLVTYLPAGGGTSYAALPVSAIGNTTRITFSGFYRCPS